jgi:regulator of protease activity HflC (stomatin/prohibitin superfamily)
MSAATPVIVYIVLAVIVYIVAGIRRANPYQRGVVFSLGWLAPPERGPGLFWVAPGIQKVHIVDLRVKTVEIPPQEVITKDNVAIKVTAVVYFQVVNPIDVIVKVENYYAYTFQRAQTTLRSVLGQHELDEILAQRDKINLDLQKVIDESTESYGVKVNTVEIKDVELPQNMLRAIAKQAEAERDRRAKIINADGEFQSAEKLTQAAQTLASQPISVSLRYLQMLAEISSDKTNTIIFPVPVDILKEFMGALRKQ